MRGFRDIGSDNRARANIERETLSMVDYRVFELGDFVLQTGGVLPNARLVFATVGRLNDAKDNVILFPTWGSGTPEEVVGLMTGPGRTLDPERYFIVIPNHFGGGFSSSPSNCAPPFEKGRFPRVTTYDNVTAQRRLLAEGLGITNLRLVAGYSMGALEAYHWATLYPDAVRAIVSIAGSARTGLFNKVFLAGIRSAIMSDPDWNNGFYGDAPPIRGLRQFARIYAGWGFSEPFYRQQVFKTAFGASSLGDFIETFWEAFFIKCDANNLLAQLSTWEHNDISAHARFGGDLEKALASIKARTILVPAATDAYFPPVDNEYEAKHIPHVEVRPIPTIWGHMSPLNPEDRPFIDRALADALQ
jgi:homoserine O-acetyltransferase/O-succinyltransferase